MKKIVLFVISFVFILASCGKDDDVVKKELLPCDFVNYKYYEGKKYVIGEVSHNYVMIAVDEKYSKSQIKQFIKNCNCFDLEYFEQMYEQVLFKHLGLREIPLKFKEPKACEELAQLIADLQKDEMVSAAHYAMKTGCREPFVFSSDSPNPCVITYSTVFHGVLLDEKDLPKLRQIVSETNTELVQLPDDKLKRFRVKATKKSKGDALKMANYFQKTGLFEYCEPNMMQFGRALE